MASLLLAIIYLAFISMGLPDSLLGAAWPVMHQELGVSSSLAGIITMIISANTIISSLMSDRLTHRFRAEKVIVISVLTTAVSLFGFSISCQFWMLCLWAIPYGLGAGAIDAALNNYVALHCNSRQMSWLHCSWGIGASVSPYIMGGALTYGAGWQDGYRNVSGIQFVITLILILSLPLWKATPSRVEGIEEVKSSGPIALRDVVRIPGAVFLFIAFFAYCGLEATAMLWTSSYMVKAKSVPVETAATFGALYVLGITAGRFISGFIADKLGDRKMIRLGIIFICIGLLTVLIPVKGTVFAVTGMLIAGFGSGPVYPFIIHATPDNFGADKSQAIIGMQMASAYVGSTFVPPLFGVIQGVVGIWLFPLFLIIFLALLIIMTEKLNRTVKSGGCYGENRACGDVL